jgi:integrase
MTPISEGTWVIRSMDENIGKESYKSLGEFSELALAGRFDAALKEATKFLDHVEKGGITKAKTVRDACDAYVKNLRGAKTEMAGADAAKRFNSYVLDDAKFASTELSRLTPAHIAAWRQALMNRPTTSGGNRGEQRTTSTLNRDMTPFRAALNHAFESGWVTTDFSWRGKLKPVEGADKKRDLYLDRDQRVKFIGLAAPDLAMFLRAMATLPVRPGALAKLTAGDFDSRLSALKIKDKTGVRTIKLPLNSAEVFMLAVKDKLPTAPLLARADGSAWNKDSWKYPIKDAAVAAKMPEGTTAYTLRHSVITDLVHGGLDLLTVAQISGTSVRMIEKHYGHLRGDIAVNALSALAI